VTPNSGGNSCRARPASIGQLFNLLDEEGVQSFRSPACDRFLGLSDMKIEAQAQVDMRRKPSMDPPVNRTLVSSGAPSA
jgi:hypothetical protein